MNVLAGTLAGKRRCTLQASKGAPRSTVKFTGVGVPSRSTDEAAQR
eukprot:CAMPEP_0198566532 /NCGR_PEP_ID=MMETSP1462-20131121/103437_1 /TAXON_ID=1333877 /ORGANISM="Brandtodinium nutriculum, Strain RCC3387" /LENGTH=45 /DNA_ID= /DNA_START= /DNA_END= /DNA_ORIENTATION=